MRCLIGIFLLSSTVVCLLKGTMYESVFRIHDSRFALISSLFLHPLCGDVPVFEDLIRVFEGPDEFLYVLIMLQKFDGKITC